MDAELLNKKLFARTEKYAAATKNIMRKRIEAIIQLCDGLDIADDSIFKFSDYKKINPKVTKELRLMYSQLYQSMRGNIEQEFEYANIKNDEFVQSIFGKDSISDNHYAKYFARDKVAMDTFFARKEEGLNLSQRVWKCVGEAKNEMELALDIGIGDGRSAAELSRDVRKYLNDPNKLFRRVRDKHGMLKLSKAAAAYHPGAGRYRSSYKNAMRLTRSEVNMAYKTADIDRWQRMDFVVGYEVKLSNNHPVEDICDTLKGKYPKEFIFKGWHPQCRCHMTAILCQKKELDELQKQIMEGGDTTGINSKNAVKKMPKQFDKWVKNNEGRIKNASSIPYFLKDNGIIDKATGKFTLTALKTKKNLAVAKGIKKIGETPTLIKKVATGAAKSTAAEKSSIIKKVAPAVKKTETKSASLFSDKEMTGKVSVAKAPTASERAAKYARLKEQAKKEALALKEKELAETKAQKVLIAKKKADAKAIKDKIKRAAAEKEAKAEAKAAADFAKKKEAFKISYRKKREEVEKAERAANAVKDVSEKELLATYGEGAERYQNMPTLQGLALRQKQYYQREKKASEFLFGTDIKATAEGIPLSKAEEKKLQQRLKDIFDRSDFGMNVCKENQEDILGKILDTKFKNQMETQSSNGLFNVRRRQEASEKLFGTDIKTAKAADYEKYGSLMDKDIMAQTLEQPIVSHYGNIQIRFKKDKVLTTFTMEDSLGLRATPSLTSRPRGCSFALDSYRVRKTLANSNGVEGAIEATKKYAEQYIELQYHGHLDASCIQSVMIPPSSLKRIDKKIIKRLKELDIPVYSYDDNRKLLKL